MNIIFIFNIIVSSCNYKFIEILLIIVIFDFELEQDRHIASEDAYPSLLRIRKLPESAELIDGSIHKFQWLIFAFGINNIDQPGELALNCLILRLM